jgi:hypothetical protein
MKPLHLVRCGPKDKKEKEENCHFMTPAVLPNEGHGKNKKIREIT